MATAESTSETEGAPEPVMTVMAEEGKATLEAVAADIEAYLSKVRCVSFA